MIEKIKSMLNKVVDKVKFFFNKDNFTKTKIVLVAIAALAAAVVAEYTIMRIYHPQFISKNRIMVVAMFFMFVGIHFVFKLKEMYEWIHNNRYKIACAFLLFTTIFRYSGSSMTCYHEFKGIQPHFDDSRYHTLLGKVRTIRTDEWSTSTPYIMSQGEGQNQHEYFSDKLRSTETDMFTISNGPVKDILMLGRPFQLGFLLLGNDYGWSFYWNIRLIAMMLGAYELCLILTKQNKKMSLLGMIMISFSAAVQWWYCMDTLIWGQIAFVLVDKFMNVDKNWKKYLCAFGILVSGLSYVFVFYPAWQLPFGYVFLALIIWALIKNIKYGNYKFTKHDIAVIVITLVCLISLLVRWYMLSGDTLKSMMSTDYPGDRAEVGGGALNNYSYFYDIYFPFEDFLNPCEFAGMLSLYPVPLILGLVYVIRNKKDLHFWIPTLVVGGFLSVWCVYGFPEWLANLTKMSMSTAGRATIPLGTISIYALIYLMASIKKEDKLIENKKITYALAFAFICLIAYQAYTTIGHKEIFRYLDKFKMLVSAEIFGAIIFGVLNMKDEKIKGYTMYGLMAVAFISGATVNPIIRTTDVLYTKPVAKKIQEIRNQEPNAVWVVDDEEDWHINNYALANGVRVLNSTNIYPNFELFEKILGKEKAAENKEKFNRYAHVNFKIVEDEETKIDLLYADNISITMNAEELDDNGIKYILSRKSLYGERSLEEYVEEIYNEDDMYIYKVIKTE